jgi:hypothetical protein
MVDGRLLMGVFGAPPALLLECQAGVSFWGVVPGATPAGATRQRSGRGSRRAYLLRQSAGSRIRLPPRLHQLSSLNHQLDYLKTPCPLCSRGSP